MKEYILRNEIKPVSKTVGESSKEFRDWEYATHGDYHRKLDPNWSYTPTYLRKMFHVRELLDGLSSEAKILDAGCGEGVLVDEYGAKGKRIYGLDLNYGSKTVKTGNVCAMPYTDESFDVVLLLYVFEHLAFDEQPKALDEIRRVLRPGGKLLISVPNLAHLNSRFRLFFKGELDRTDIETNHVGERPCKENKRLILRSGFIIESMYGITLTVPYIYRNVICRRAAQFRWLHDAFEPLARRAPSLAMLTHFLCRKP